MSFYNEEEEEDSQSSESFKVCLCFYFQAAAALCISVGSFSDPEDLPGLAHFLEHSESTVTTQ